MVSNKTYRVELKPTAISDLKKLDRRALSRVSRKIDSLASNPHPSGTKKLTGVEDLWRIRVGDYRIIYTIRDAVLVVLVIRIGHRREVYR